MRNSVSYGARDMPAIKKELIGHLETAISTCTQGVWHIAKYRTHRAGIEDGAPVEEPRPSVHIVKE